MKKISIIFGVILLGTIIAPQIFTLAVAGSDTKLFVEKDVTELTIKEVTKKFKELSGWSAEVTATEQSPVDDFYQVISDGRVFYVSKDGKHMFSGNLFDFGEKFVNRTEPRVRESRLDMIKKYEENYIEYTAKEEAHVIYVFTDPTCGYCNKLHGEIQGYNELGITLRYIPYPRSGKAFNNGQMNPVFVNVNNALCLPGDVKSNFDGLFSGTKYKKQKNCSDKFLTDIVDLGQKLGISGTPAIITKSGTILKGYLSPRNLLNSLEG